MCKWFGGLGGREWVRGGRMKKGNFVPLTGVGLLMTFANDG